MSNKENPIIGATDDTGLGWVLIVSKRIPESDIQYLMKTANQAWNKKLGIKRPSEEKHNG